MPRDKSGRAILSLTRRARDLQLTWQQLLAGHLSADKAPRWLERIADVLSRGDQDPISKPKPYIKQHFPKIHELRFANEWQPIHCDLGVMTTAINQLRERGGEKGLRYSSYSPSKENVALGKRRRNFSWSLFFK